MPNLNEPYSILDLTYLAFGFALLGGYVYAVHKLDHLIPPRHKNLAFYMILLGFLPIFVAVSFAFRTGSSPRSTTMAARLHRMWPTASTLTAFSRGSTTTAQPILSIASQLPRLR